MNSYHYLRDDIVVMTQVKRGTGQQRVRITLRLDELMDYLLEQPKARVVIYRKVFDHLCTTWMRLNQEQAS